MADKRQQRKAKEKARLKGTRLVNARGVEDESVQRRRFRNVLERLGMRAVFERLPKHLREQMYVHRYPEPVLNFDPAWPQDEKHTRLREKLEKAFRSATIEFDDPQERGDLAVRDLFSFVIGMHAICSGTRHSNRLREETNDMTGTLLPKTQMPAEVGLFCELATPILEAVLELQQEAFLSLHRAVVVPLTERCRLDATLFYADLTAEKRPRFKTQVIMTIKATPPQSKSIRLDGHERPVYRVGTNNEWHAVSWLSIDGEAIDPQWTGRPLEVYAQSHALRQLHARVNVPSIERYAAYWLYASLKEPKVVERQRGGDVLIEYRIGEHRLGYLVATPLEDKLIVRTFLFLTMQPTPESRLLEKRLKLTRRDSDWLGLTELSAFTNTDLRNDPTLRPMLEACGCGHLFNLADEEWATEGLAPEPRPFADEMKKYLRLAA